jgi:hypothetical protein
MTDEAKPCFLRLLHDMVDCVTWESERQYPSRGKDSLKQRVKCVDRSVRGGNDLWVVKTKCELIQE